MSNKCPICGNPWIFMGKCLYCEDSNDRKIRDQKYKFAEEKKQDAIKKAILECDEAQKNAEKEFQNKIKDEYERRKAKIEQESSISPTVMLSSSKKSPKTKVQNPNSSSSKETSITATIRDRIPPNLPQYQRSIKTTSHSSIPPENPSLKSTEKISPKYPVSPKTFQGKQVTATLIDSHLICNYCHKAIQEREKYFKINVCNCCYHYSCLPNQIAKSAGKCSCRKPLFK